MTVTEAVTTVISGNESCDESSDDSDESSDDNSDTGMMEQQRQGRRDIFFPFFLSLLFPFLASLLLLLFPSSPPSFSFSQNQFVFLQRSEKKRRGDLRRETEHRQQKTSPTQNRN